MQYEKQFFPRGDPENTVDLTKSGTPAPTRSMDIRSWLTKPQPPAEQKVHFPPSAALSSPLRSPSAEHERGLFTPSIDSNHAESDENQSDPDDDLVPLRPSSPAPQLAKFSAHILKRESQNTCALKTCSQQRSVDDSSHGDEVPLVRCDICRSQWHFQCVEASLPEDYDPALAARLPGSCPGWFCADCCWEDGVSQWDQKM